MKKIIFITLLSIAFLAACNDSEVERLKAENDSLRSVTNVDAQQLNEFMQAFNEIQQNLNTIKEKEKIISMKTQSANSGELDESAKEQINEDILTIYELMLKNKKTIKRLNYKLSKTKSKNKELQKTIQLLTAQIEQKDQEINELKEQLAKLNFDIQQLNQQVNELSTTVDTLQQVTQEQSKTIEEQTIALNTAYYVIGTKRELKDHNVITKEGLFKGIKIGENFDKSYFTKIDIRQTSVIPINSKRINILSTHPKDSYTIVEEDGKVKEIKITDSKRFWEVTKFLVIIVK